MARGDAEQVIQSNPLKHIKVLIRIRLMMAYENGTLGLGPPKYLLTWDPWKNQSNFKQDDKVLSSFR